ncbi:MAG: SCO family protein [Acidobacteriota bacterium]
MKKAMLSAVFLALFLSVSAGAQQTGYAEPGLDEKLGGSVPLDLTFSKEDGERVILKELVDRPTVLMLVYYSCSHICPQFLGGFADSLASLRLDPARDYRVLTVSFDETDRPMDARELKKNYIKAIGCPFPENTWHFLTGNQDNIMRLSDAVGVRFTMAGHGFVHPEVLIFLSPQGKITRYLQAPKYGYGIVSPMTFSAIDLKTGFADASLGKVFASGRGVTPLFCFLHEPANQVRFFNMLKVTGALTLLGLFLLFVYLRSGKKSTS